MRHQLIFFSLAAILFGFNAAAFEIPKADIVKTTLKMSDNVPYKSIDITIDKRLSRAKDENFQNVLNEAGKESTFFGEYPFDVKLTTASTEFYHVVCGDDPSADPHCTFVGKTCHNDDYLNAQGGCPPSAKIDIPGLQFYVPGDGCIYAEGHTDNYFNERRVYCGSAEGITEKVQPLMYVGLKSKTTKAVILYADKGNTQILTEIPKDHFIEILLHDNPPDKAKLSDLYFVRDEFGVSGWAKLAGGTMSSPPGQNPGDVVGLFYFGD